MDLSLGRGVAIREFALASGHGFADYLLSVDEQAVGFLEAKPGGHPLAGVEFQAEKYARGLPEALSAPVRPLPFVYLNGGEIRFTNLLDPDPRSREQFHFKTNRMRPEELGDCVACDRPGERGLRQPTWSADQPEGPWRAYTFDELIQQDKVSLDVFWLCDESLATHRDLPEPHVIAEDIAHDLRAALGQIEGVLSNLERRVGKQR